MIDSPKKRILVTVKTYPNISEKYIELVCTAGLTENGKWVRLYPVPFRASASVEQYRKFDWIECSVIRNTKDFRVESYKPVDFHSIEKISHVGTGNGWRERNDLVLGKAEVYEDLDSLISRAKSERISLAVYKPKEITDFIIKSDSRQYDESKLSRIEAKLREHDMFEDNSWRESFELVNKLPRSFAYEFLDKDGSNHSLSILDWEIGALFWKTSQYDEENFDFAEQQVRKKYWNEFMEKDLYFFLGTTLEYHMRAPNPFTIVGVYYPPKLDPMPLFENSPGE